MKEGKFVANLRCDLEGPEVDARATDLVRFMHEKTQIQTDLEEVKKEARLKIEALDTRIATLATEIRTRSVYRDVECEAKPDYAGARIAEYRLDNGELVRWRPMEPHERQVRLFRGPEAEDSAEG